MDTKKGLKQVASVHCNALLHPYFSLMCNSTTVRIILQQIKQENPEQERYINTSCQMIADLKQLLQQIQVYMCYVVQLHIKVKQGCRSTLRYNLFWSFFGIPIYAYFLQNFFSYTYMCSFEFPSTCIMHIQPRSCQ